MIQFEHELCQSVSQSECFYRQDLPEGQLCQLLLLTDRFLGFRPAGATRCTDQGEINLAGKSGP